MKDVSITIHDAGVLSAKYTDHGGLTLSIGAEWPLGDVINLHGVHNAREIADAINLANAPALQRFPCDENGMTPDMYAGAAE